MLLAGRSHPQAAVARAATAMTPRAATSSRERAAGGSAGAPVPTSSAPLDPDSSSFLRAMKTVPRKIEG